MKLRMWSCLGMKNWQRQGSSDLRLMYQQDIHSSWSWFISTRKNLTWIHILWNSCWDMWHGCFNMFALRSQLLSQPWWFCWRLCYTIGQWSFRRLTWLDSCRKKRICAAICFVLKMVVKSTISSSTFLHHDVGMRPWWMNAYFVFLTNSYICLYIWCVAKIQGKSFSTIHINLIQFQSRCGGVRLFFSKDCIKTQRCEWHPFTARGEYFRLLDMLVKNLPIQMLFQNEAFWVFTEFARSMPTITYHLSTKIGIQAFQVRSIFGSGKSWRVPWLTMDPCRGAGFSTYVLFGCVAENLIFEGFSPMSWTASPWVEKPPHELKSLPMSWTASHELNLLIVGRSQSAGAKEVRRNSSSFFCTVYEMR